MKSVNIRRGREKDASAIGKLVAEWLKWDIPRENSIKRAIENNELLVAEWKSEIIGFIHYVIHEDIIDGGLNAFITAFYIVPRFRNKRIGSSLLKEAIESASEKGVVGISASTANPDARRLYERHNFKQFMGEWIMGEIFLELDMTKYKQKRKREIV
jgi:GNAT superfamily N-acetyltransferase